MDQDFDKKKKDKDAAIAEKDEDNLDQDQQDKFAELFPTEEIASKSATEGADADETLVSQTQ